MLERALVQPGVKTLIGQARLVSIEDNVAVFSFAAMHDIQMKMLERNGKKEIVRDALSRLLDRDVGVKIELGIRRCPCLCSRRRSRLPSGNSRGRKARVPQPPSTRARAGDPITTAAPPPQSKRPTPEQIAALRQESPLICSLMDELGGDVQRIDA